MKDVLLYLANNGFQQSFINIAVGGFVAGFGFSLILSMIGYSVYKTFNLIERSTS